MATLSVTNAFIAGTLAKSSEVNQNFIDLINWSSGQIQNDNLGVMFGNISWNITTGVKALTIANAGNEGSILITQSSSLNPNKSSFRLINNAAQTLGDADMYLSMTSLSSTVPIFRADYAGSSVFQIKKDRILFPVRTLTQRDAISAPENGSILYVEDASPSKHRGVHVKHTEGWAPLGVPAGVTFDFAGTVVPEGYLLCDGSEVSQTTYATLFAAIGTVWNTGGESVGNFRLPDLRRRTTIGSGGTAVAGPANTVGSVGGSEQLQSHSHSLSGSTSSDGNHGHTINSATVAIVLDCGSGAAGARLDVAPGGGIHSLVGTTSSFGPGNDFQNVSPFGSDPSHSHSMSSDGSHSHSISGSTTSSGSGSSENMQPSAVMNKIIKW